MIWLALAFTALGSFATLAGVLIGSAVAVAKQSRAEPDPAAQLLKASAQWVASMATPEGEDEREGVH